jgi:hypothetical protein
MDNEQLMQRALATINKQSEVIAELESRLARLLDIAESLGIEKSKLTKSLSQTAAEVLKNASAPKRKASNRWTPKLDFEAANKSRVEKAAEPVEGPLAEVSRKLRGQ